MEQGNGGDRNQYLKEHNIKTYLVVVPDEFNDVCIKSIVLFLLIKKGNHPHNTIIMITIISIDAKTKKCEWHGKERINANAKEEGRSK